MPSFVPGLKPYMRELSKRLGGETALKYEAMGARLGVSRTTVGNLMAGIPSAREKVRQMADTAGIARSPFLVASGYTPTDEDRDWDCDRYFRASILITPRA